MAAGLGSSRGPLKSEPLPLSLHSLHCAPHSGRQPPRMGVASLLAKETPLPVGPLLFTKNDRLPVPWPHPLSPFQGRPVSCPLRFPATALLYLGGFGSPLICTLGVSGLLAFCSHRNNSQSLSWLLFGGFSFL